MPKYSILDKDGNLLAVIDGQSEEQALACARGNYPNAASAEEKPEHQTRTSG